MNLALWLAVCFYCYPVASAQQAGTGRSGVAPYDGTGNNIKQPSWGAARTPFIRHPINVTDYTRTVVEMAGPNRPHPRDVSLALMSSPYFKALNEKRTTNILTAMGQYAAVDMTNRGAMPDNATQAQGMPTAPITVPHGDPFMSNFTGNNTISPLGSRRVLKFKRSLYVRDDKGVRQQMNHVTHFLDASAVYGDSAGEVQKLRVGDKGLLKDDGAGGLPFNIQGTGYTAQAGGEAGKPLVDTTDDAYVAAAGRMRAAGFSAVNQHPGLLVMATIWLREHNRRAAQAVKNNPSISDEDAFQYARKWVMAHLQHTIYEEYLPVLLGALLPPYTGYNESVNPSVDNFFCTVALRYGHAVVTDTVMRLDENGNEHPKGHLLLDQCWYQPDKVLAAGVKPIIRGLVSSSQGAVEPRFSSAIQHNLFGPSNMNGSDLFAINIQRGRDHGLPDYNTCRRLFGLAPLARFEDINPDDPELAATLHRLYGGRIDDVDPYVGALAEPKFGNGHVGQLIFSSIYDQIRRSRDGDWYYFGNQDNGLFTIDQISEVKTTSLRDIILRNTNITHLPDNIWRITEDAALGTCAAAGSTGSGSNTTSNNTDSLYTAAVKDVQSFSVLGGAVKLEMSEAADPGWVRVKIDGSFGSGFLGFGVAKQGQVPGQKMVGADMAIARILNGQPTLQDFHAVGHQPPILDSDSGGKDNLRLLNYQRANGRTVLEFERPYAASDENNQDQPILKAGPNSFLVAHGLDDTLAYHGVDNRVAIELPGLLFGQASTVREVSSIDPTALNRRIEHGTLMAVNFILVFPVGALMARQLRAKWLKSSGVKAVLFYLHIGTQVCGVGLATGGFVIATRQFEVPVKQVMLHHGTLGVAVLACVYAQLLLGFIRPPAGSAAIRGAWQVLHALMGRATLLLGVINVFIGVYLLNTLYKGDIAVWGGWCAAGLGVIFLVQNALDLLERHAGESLVAQFERLPSTRQAGGGGAGKPQLTPSGDSQDLTGVFSGELPTGKELHGVDGPPQDCLWAHKDQNKQHTAGEGASRPGNSDKSLTENPGKAYLSQPAGWLGNSQQQRPLAEGTNSENNSPQFHPAAAAAAAGVSSPCTVASEVAVDIAPSSTEADSRGRSSSETPTKYPIVKALSRSVFGSTLDSTKHMLVSGSKRLFSIGRRGEDRKSLQGPQSPRSSGVVSRGSVSGPGSGPGSSIWGSAFAAAAAAAPSNDSIFCDYESAGVYDPNSGAFHAADRSKKPAVMEYRMQPISPGLGLDQSLNGSHMTRKQSSRSGSGRVSRKYSGGNVSSSGSSSSWRAAAAAAAAAESGPGVVPRTRSAPGSQIASKIAASKVLRKNSADSWNSDLSDGTAADVADLERANTAPTAVGYALSSAVGPASARQRDRVTLGRAAGIANNGVSVYRSVSATNSSGPAVAGSSSGGTKRSVTSTGRGVVDGAPAGPSGMGTNDRSLAVHNKPSAGPRALQPGTTRQHHLVLQDSVVEEVDETG